MKFIEILSKIKESEIEREKALESYRELSRNVNELCDKLCKNITLDDLRPMRKEDIIVGQRVFGENDDGIYTFIIEEVLGYGDLDFKSFVAEGCRYGIFEHYVLKD